MNILSSLHKSIIEYIQHEINTINYSADCLESLEVAKECLESVWNIEHSDASNGLSKIFEAGYHVNTNQQVNNAEDIEIDEDDKMAAERLKTQGNICMGENLFTDAVSCYSKAIELHPRNAVYYCNRAAAYNKLNKNDCAVEDCQHALKIDASYGKAYSRMGLAYTAMGNFNEAISCYKRAIELEPDNPNYKQNLQTAEERKSSGVTTSTGPSSADIPPIPNLHSALQNFDISSILNNPVMMNMAQQMISQPEMRNMMTQMMQTMMPPTGGATVPPGGPSASEPSRTPTENTGTPDTTNINNILAFGQQIQSTNPEVVDSLRNRSQETSNAGNNTDHQK